MVVKRFDRKLGRPKVVLKLSSGYSKNSAKGWVNGWALLSTTTLSIGNQAMRIPGAASPNKMQRFTAL